MDSCLIRDNRVQCEQMWYDSLRSSPNPTSRKERRSSYFPVNSQKEIFMMVPQQAYLNDKNQISLLIEPRIEVKPELNCKRTHSVSNVNTRN